MPDKKDGTGDGADLGDSGGSGDLEVKQLGWFWYVFGYGRCLASGLTEDLALERAAVRIDSRRKLAQPSRFQPRKAAMVLVHSCRRHRRFHKPG